jgi:hypothetical protein
MRERKEFWLAPIIIVMVLVAAPIELSQRPAVAPFIHTLFWDGVGVASWPASPSSIVAA